MKKYLSIAAFTAAIAFAGAGMFIPPQGVIDGSVLILVAQLLVLCATFLGISPPKPSQGGLLSQGKMQMFDSDWLANNIKSN